MAKTVEVKLAKERLRVASARLRSAAPAIIATAIGSGAIVSLIARKSFRRAAITGIRWAVHAFLKQRKSA